MARHVVLVAVFLVVGGTPVLHGQGGRPIRARGMRSLSFGPVLPGVPRSVTRTDAVNSGEFEVTGRRLSTVQLSFTLPSSMTGPLGASLPLTFGGNDAGYSVTQSVTSQIGFDPRVAFLAVLSRNGRGSVFMGGTARPLPSQRPGTYTGTITLTVAYFP